MGLPGAGRLTRLWAARCAHSSARSSSPAHFIFNRPVVGKPRATLNAAPPAPEGNRPSETKSPASAVLTLMRCTWSPLTFKKHSGSRLHRWLLYSRPTGQEIPFMKSSANGLDFVRTLERGSSTKQRGRLADRNVSSAVTLPSCCSVTGWQSGPLPPAAGPLGK